MNKALDKKMAIVVIILSTILMQIHSIEYWTGVTESYGMAWSIALEAAMLWLWYQKRLFLVRVLAATILIAGPWYVLTEPAITSLQEQTQSSHHVASAEAKVKRLTKSLDRFESNSMTKLGWSGRIDRTMTKLELAEDELQKSKDKALDLGFKWRLYMVAGMQASVLLIVLITQLLAVAGLRDSHVSKPVSKSHNKSKQPLNPTAETSKYEQAIRAVAIAIKRKLPEYGGSQKALADHYGFRPKDVSMLFNHFERKKAGKEVISRKALQFMVEKLWTKRS
jgi:hypothetical protein